MTSSSMSAAGNMNADKPPPAVEKPMTSSNSDYGVKLFLIECELKIKRLSLRRCVQNGSILKAF